MQGCYAFEAVWNIISPQWVSTTLRELPLLLWKLTSWFGIPWRLIRFWGFEALELQKPAVRWFRTHCMKWLCSARKIRSGTVPSWRWMRPGVVRWSKSRWNDTCNEASDSVETTSTQWRFHYASSLPLMKSQQLALWAEQILKAKASPAADAIDYLII